MPEVDAYGPAERLAVQLDSFAFRRTRRDREKDAASDADLELALGSAAVARRA
jgi:hypothetical protein